MAINPTVTSIAIFTPEGRKAPFNISIFGVDSREFAMIPGGGNKVHESFKLEGLGEGYEASPFFVFKVGEEELSPPRYENKRMKEKEMMESAPLFSEFAAVFEPKRQSMLRVKTKAEMRDEKRNKK